MRVFDVAQSLQSGNDFLSNFAQIGDCLKGFFRHLDADSEFDNFIDVINQILESLRFEGEISCKVSSVYSGPQALNFTSCVGL